MEKLLSIIIPFKNERENNLAIALASINMQMAINFSKIEVILVNDGGEPIDVSKFAIFTKLDIKYFEIENVGPGMARQYGIEHSSSEYIMFIDADDMLYYSSALMDMLNTVLKEKHDIVVARYVEQKLTQGGKETLYPHPLEDAKAVYAKLFKRAYLEENKLAFHPKLRVMEDSYFVALALDLTEDVFYLEKFVYAWLDNKNSLNRNQGTKFDNQLHYYIWNNRFRLEENKRRQTKKYQEAVEMFTSGYMAEVYLRYKLYGAIDEELFWKEQQAFVQEFQDVMPRDVLVIQEIVNAKKATEKKKYNKLRTNDLEQFMNKSWQKEKA
ncbi:MAG: glycosyltransferase family 2 protein [Streptococcaceae bacterium]|jgi:glycosyltransferase involved in cell wall biosynthesis|nr:glycosyltransferase family 2 protein [Streptococcaceae bacterium]